MIKVKVYEIVERYFDVEEEVFVNTSIGLPPFANEESAIAFVKRCSSTNYPHYYNLNEEYKKTGSYLSYQEKEIKVFETLEEYDRIIKQKAKIQETEKEME